MKLPMNYTLIYNSMPNATQEKPDGKQETKRGKTKEEQAQQVCTFLPHTAAVVSHCKITRQRCDHLIQYLQHTQLLTFRITCRQQSLSPFV
jgi:hypothetical protein